MASPCEVHVAGTDRRTAEHIAAVTANEARRIERKWSRYRDDNIVHAINSAGGRPVRIDDETARMLRYADELNRLSAGRFDVTSGILRKVWRFDGSDRVPSAAAVRALLAKIGWWRVRFEPPYLTLEPGMEIDFGGIGKEYAVDRAAALVRPVHPHCLINFGGDLLALGPRDDGSPWLVGIEPVDGRGHGIVDRIELTVGALATSGDARRFLLKDGRRYGHILDPRTGWPVRGAPRSVTVAAPTCTEAGMLATIALLHGARAERFLESQNVKYWCRRGSERKAPGAD
ncbi:MAG TPA: FAD:protein FMN transferase [Gammaproteobacteria bacterium]